MKYLAKAQVTREFVNQSRVAEEYIYRDLIMRLVQDIPLDDLKKVFKLAKIDPRKELELGSYSHAVEYLSQLDFRELVEYEACIEIHNPYTPNTNQ